MEFERIPTVPTADEVLGKALRRAAVRMKKKHNVARANEEFVRAVYMAVHDRLVAVMRSFPEFEDLPPFYYETAGYLFGMDRLKKALGAVGWAARWSRDKRNAMVIATRKSGEDPGKRRQAIARLSSVVHQIDNQLIFLNEVRNVLRLLPHIEDTFTVVVGGYPNVGKSSFIKSVSTAKPEIARYPFTTKGVIVGIRESGRERVQFIDTPGILDRPSDERNPIELQALSALNHLANLVIFLLDPSEHCGYPLTNQLVLLEEVKNTLNAPLIAISNKSDICPGEGYPLMSTETGEGINEVLTLIESHAKEYFIVKKEKAREESRQLYSH